MQKTLLIIKNLAVQGNAPSEVVASIGYVQDNMKEVLEAIAEGEIG